MTLWGIIKGLLVQDESDRSKQLSLEIDPTSTTATKTILKSAQTANRTLVLPDASDTLVGKATADTLTNKTIDADLNVITNIENADIKVNAAIDATKIADGSVTNAEFQRINSVTSNVQDQLNANAAAAAAAQATADNHIADPTDAHDASAISYSPGTVTASDVQAAIEEVQLNLTTHINDPSAAHAASAISVGPSGNLSSTDVQSALVELQDEIDNIVGASGVTSASNVGSGAGIYKQRVADDLQFKSLTAGTGITLTPNTNDIQISGPDISNLANKSLSNLTSPTAINQDLIFDTSGARFIGFDPANTTNPGRGLSIRAGNSAGTNIAGGTLQLQAGSSTGQAGASIEFYTPQSGGASSSTPKTTFLTASLSSTQSINTLLLKTSPTIGISDLIMTSGNGGNIIRGTDYSSAADLVNMTIQGAANTGTGRGGGVVIATASKTVAGQVGDIQISTGSSTSGNSGSISLITGLATGGSRGSVEVTSRYFRLASTPLVFSNTTVGITTTEDALPHDGNGVVKVTTTGASTIRGIAAGLIEGQLLIIMNVNGNNLSFANESANAAANDRITTQTGATITSTGASMHQLIYLNNRWQYLSGQL